MHRSPARKLQYVGAMAVAGVAKGSRVKVRDDRRDNSAPGILLLCSSL